MTYATPKEYLNAFKADPSLAILPLQTVAEFRGVSRAAIDAMLRKGKLDEIKIGKTRYVRLSSLVALEGAYEEQVKTVRAHLEGQARHRAVTTYEPVMALVGLSPTIPADRTAIGAILGTIGHATYAESGIVLSVIVHRKTLGKTRPGPGFFNLVENLGLEWDDDDDLVREETEKVWRFYRKPA